jgi:hypothetical protein
VLAPSWCCGIHATQNITSTTTCYLDNKFKVDFSVLNDYIEWCQIFLVHSVILRSCCKCWIGTVSWLVFSEVEGDPVIFCLKLVDEAEIIHGQRASFNYTTEPCTYSIQPSSQAQKIVEVAYLITKHFMISIIPNCHFLCPNPQFMRDDNNSSETCITEHKECRYSVNVRGIWKARLRECTIHKNQESRACMPLLKHPCKHFIFAKIKQYTYKSHCAKIHFHTYTRVQK